MRTIFYQMSSVHDPHLLIETKFGLYEEKVAHACLKGKFRIFSCFPCMSI